MLVLLELRQLQQGVQRNRSLQRRKLRSGLSAWPNQLRRGVRGFERRPFPLRRVPQGVLARSELRCVQLRVPGGNAAMHGRLRPVRREQLWNVREEVFGR